MAQTENRRLKSELKAKLLENLKGKPEQAHPMKTTASNEHDTQIKT